MPASTILATLVVGLSALTLATPDTKKGYLPPTNPNWSPAWKLSDSTLAMACNSSGWLDPVAMAKWGVVSFDWSNHKGMTQGAGGWAQHRPMNDEKDMLTQAVRTKQAGGKHVFVYRNLVKALPWMESVRKIVNDPRYEGFFLKFKDNTSKMHVPRCDPTIKTKCSMLYHDQEQSPAVPTKANPNPDGACPETGCDCGPNAPCGEYLWDHRNGTQLQTWLMENYIMSATSVGAPEIDGLFIDDYWCSTDICEATSNRTAGCPCSDPVQGPSEINKFSQTDMGLSDADIRNITLGWNNTMRLAQERILAANGSTWSLFAGQENANAEPFVVNTEAGCTVLMESACKGGSNVASWQNEPQLFGMTDKVTPNGLQMKQIEMFHLVRGPYAWIGLDQWGMEWPGHQQPNWTVLDKIDYGVPNGLCTKTGASTWERVFEKGTVTVNCTTVHE